jgi:hypothetical protein
MLRANLPQDRHTRPQSYWAFSFSEIVSMSVQASSWVIEHSQHKGSTLLVLLMIANHAHADGSGAYPSLSTLARESRLSQRQVIRILKQLERSGELTVVRSKEAGLNNVNYYTVMMQKGVVTSCQSADLSDEKIDQNVTRGSDILSSETVENVTTLVTSEVPHIRKNHPLTIMNHHANCHVEPGDLLNGFRIEYLNHYKLDYVTRMTDGLRLLQLRGQIINLDVRWKRAVENYFLSELSDHNVTDLCKRFATFHKNPIDRFKQPIDESDTVFRLIQRKQKA